MGETELELQKQQEIHRQVLAQFVSDIETAVQEAVRVGDGELVVHAGDREYRTKVTKDDVEKADWSAGEMTIDGLAKHCLREFETAGLDTSDPDLPELTVEFQKQAGVIR